MNVIQVNLPTECPICSSEMTSLRYDKIRYKKQEKTERISYECACSLQFQEEQGMIVTQSCSRATKTIINQLNEKMRITTGF